MKPSSVLFLFLFISLISLKQNAQNKHDLAEFKGGYRGGFIKGLTIPDSALNFLVIGDWGRCGEFFQKEVAEQMAFASVSGDASFIISTGDNFYPRGVKSVDDPLWIKSYENVYNQYSLQKDWYVVLGNHDYKINPDAEVEYSKKSSRWIMPSRYYSVKMPVDGDTNSKALFVFIDTNPFIEKYYNDPEYGKMVKTQDTSAQKQWLTKVLAENDPAVKWKFVVGHHPLYTSGKRIKSAETLQFRKVMEPILKQFSVDAYICGHEHQLEYIKPEGSTHHFISGAGSEARDVKGNLPESKFKASDHGFMLFSVGQTQLKVQVINWEGKILYQQVLKK
ncbi:acid phosphatase [Sphingobacteriaceae bacterium]|nr:acid phosphatase [Sphingobacteriaceae bacterium]